MICKLSWFLWILSEISSSYPCKKYRISIEVGIHNMYYWYFFFFLFFLSGPNWYYNLNYNIMLCWYQKYKLLNLMVVFAIIDYCTRYMFLSVVIAARLNFIELVTFFTWKLLTENFVIFKNAGWLWLSDYVTHIPHKAHIEIGTPLGHFVLLYL